MLGQCRWAHHAVAAFAPTTSLVFAAARIIPPRGVELFDVLELRLGVLVAADDGRKSPEIDGAAS